jgi:hypothetical protein
MIKKLFNNADILKVFACFTDSQNGKQYVPSLFCNCYVKTPILAMFILLWDIL